MIKTWEQLQETQPNVVRMLVNSFRKDRVAHAYLFEGSKGTGKRAVAVQMAKSLFCHQKTSDEPCQECSDCKRITSGNHPDVHVIEPDGLSIKISQIRDLQKEFAYTGMESNQKVYIIDHADRMTVQAANSLLKFLEEPGTETVAILLTEQIHQMLDTILSRCQTLSFKPLSPEDLVEQLKMEGASDSIARVAGSLNSDYSAAMELVKNDWFVQARVLVIQLSEVLYQRPHQSLFFIQDKWLQHFKEKDELDRGLDLLLLWQKDLLYIQIGEERQVVFSDQMEILKQQALHSSQKKVTDHISAILEAKRRLSANMNPQLLMEQTVLRLQEG